MSELIHELILGKTLMLADKTVKINTQYCLGFYNHSNYNINHFTDLKLHITIQFH